MHTRRVLPIVCAAALVACARDAAAPATPADDAPWMRPAEQGASSALYFTLRNPGPDTLVLTGVEIDVAAHTMIHRSVERNGMASMEHLESVAVPPHDSAVFRARGLHVMAMDLHAALQVGDTVVARLRLGPTRVDTLRAVVRE